MREKVFEAPKEKSNEEQFSGLVSSRTSVLLQTADAIISDTSEKNNRPITILLDSGSQRTYVTQRIVKELNLLSVASKEMTVKTFGDADGKPAIYSEYRFCIKNPKWVINLYMTGYAVPYICSPLAGQRIQDFKKSFPNLKNSEFSNMGTGDGDIDLLIGADYYWTVVEGSVKRCGADGPIALNTKLGWVLKGFPSANLMVTHVMNVVPDVGVDERDGDLNNVVEKVWDLETLGIKEKSRRNNRK